MSANGAASDDLPNSEVDTMVSSREIDWLDVTQRIQAGDTESFKVYYENHFDLMFREAKRLSFADDNRCLDIVHDAMLKAIKSMKSTHLESRLVVWSKTVVKCVVYDRLRKQTADRKRELEYHQQKESASAHAWDAQLENQARLLWIEQQIMELQQEVKNLQQAVNKVVAILEKK